MSAVDAWSIISSVVSVIIGVFAIWLSIYFFIQNKNTEKGVQTSLTKIETQADSLQKINAKWMDRLTRYVTENRPNPAQESMQLIKILTTFTNPISGSISGSTQQDSQEKLINEIFTCYIGLYFYVAQTNYWAQNYLPKASEFDAENEFHKVVKKIVDMSCLDFSHIAKILEGCDQQRLKSNSIAHLLNETQGFWRHRVMSAADMFVEQEKQEHPA